MGFFRLFFISIIMFLASCTGTIEKPNRKGLIPERKLAPLLTEIHLANGLISSYAVQEWAEIDSLTTYHYIAEKHGYTKEALDKTLYYYFLKKPKKLVAIYEKVMAELGEIEESLSEQIRIDAERRANVWTGMRNYYYPVSTENSNFEISFFASDSYLLKFTATLFPDDPSINAKARLYAVRSDSALTGSRIYFETPNFIKDGKPHEYEINISIGQYRYMILKVMLYDVTNNVREQQRHVSFENIELRNLSIRP